jgi:hypothetical protein
MFQTGRAVQFAKFVIKGGFENVIKLSECNHLFQIEVRKLTPKDHRHNQVKLTFKNRLIYLVNEKLPFGVSFEEHFQAFEICLDQGEVAPEDGDWVWSEEQVDPGSKLLPVTGNQIFDTFP